MNREQIIETMARGITSVIHDADPDGKSWLALEKEAYTSRELPFVPLWQDFTTEAVVLLGRLEAAGLVVVPVEPTPAMQEAGQDADFFGPVRVSPAADVYTAMIKAAQEGKP